MICPGVWRVAGPEVTDEQDCCVYLVDGGGELVLIDAGLGPSVPQILDNIAALGFDPGQVRYLVATHGHIDHIGGLAGLKAATGGTVCAHQGDLRSIQEGLPELTAASYYGVSYQPVGVDLVFSQAHETLTAGLRTLTVLHAPGHTPGSIVLYGDFDGTRVLFAQDLHGPFDPAWGSNLSQWRHTARMLLELEADILCEGHFGVFRPREKAQAYIERWLEAYRDL
jgi:glyoxylase-like metal-dependent hydrolase (beta-lactamase superfamily II)